MCFSWDWPVLFCLPFSRFYQLFTSINFKYGGSSWRNWNSCNGFKLKCNTKLLRCIKRSSTKFMNESLSIYRMSTLIWFRFTCGLAFLCRCNLSWLLSVLLDFFSIIGLKSIVFFTDVNGQCQAHGSFTMSWFDSYTPEDFSTLLAVLLLSIWFR